MDTIVTDDAANTDSVASFEEGSIVWSRSGPREKWWPSVVFRSWEAAKDMGFVPDGIAFLIEVGRKIDVTDEEAAPREGEFLNLYLGENPEWQFIVGHEGTMLPFKEYREALSKQRLGAQLKHQFAPALIAADAMCSQQGFQAAGYPVALAHHNPRRAGVLLDFGTGTSFASFAELWNYLVHNGWHTVPGKGLASWHYFPPGSDPKMRHPVLNKDYFNSEDSVINHVRVMGLERPAPVRKGIPRPKPTPSAAAKHPPTSTASAPPKLPQPSSAKSVAKTSSSNNTTVGKKSRTANGDASSDDVSSPDARPVESSSSSPANFKSSGNIRKSDVAGQAASAVPVPNSAPPRGSSGGGVTSWLGDGSSRGGGAARDFDVRQVASGNSERSAAGGGGSTANGCNRYEEEEEEELEVIHQDDNYGDGSGGGGGSGDSHESGHGLLIAETAAPAAAGIAKDYNSDGLGVSAGGEGNGGGGVGGAGGGGGGSVGGKGASSGVAESAGLKRDRNGRQQLGSGSKRSSHGRTMQKQVEAMQSSSRGGAPKLAGEVMRQAVNARERTSAPPAPSPSKRPKRVVPRLPPQELVRLAGKQLAYLSALVESKEKPYPGPVGLEGPVASVVKFVKEAHSAWGMHRAGGRVSPTDTRRSGAIVLAGPGGSGKTTAYQAAMRASAKSIGGSTLRFVTIKCEDITTKGRQSDVFSKVLGAVTGTSARVDGDSALENLKRLADPPPFLAVLCLEDGGCLEEEVMGTLMDMAYAADPLFALVAMVHSLDRGYNLGYEQGNLERECSVVPMLPCGEVKIRAILGQTLGAAGPEDRDGELIASLVNKGALDVIAKTVARVCGSVRIALNVCIMAFVQRQKELSEQYATCQQEEPLVGSSTAVAIGTPKSSSNFSSSPSPSSSIGANASVLLNVAGAKGALNKYLRQGPQEVWGPDV